MLARRLVLWLCCTALATGTVPRAAAAVQAPSFAATNDDVDQAYILQDAAEKAFEDAEQRRDTDPAAAASLYGEAAAKWREAVGKLPENRELRRDRGSLVLQFVAAVERQVALTPSDPAPLRAARRFLDDYFKSLTAAYGPGANALDEWKAANRELARVDAALAGFPPEGPEDALPPQPGPAPTQQKQQIPAGLVAGLGVSGFLLLGSAGAVIGLDQRMRSMHKQGAEAMDRGDQTAYEALAAEQNTARNAAIAMSVLGGVALVATAVFSGLTGKALRKRSRSQPRAVPVAGGVGLRLRF